jgi:hypothetical protein
MGLPKAATTREELEQGFISGWRLKKQFVHEDGRVFEFGTEKPELRGTIEPTISSNKIKRMRNSKKSKKKNSLDELKELEKLKVDFLTNIDVMETVDASIIRDILSSNGKTPKAFADLLKQENIDIESMNIDKYRMHVISLYIQSQLEEME